MTDEVPFDDRAEEPAEAIAAVIAAARKPRTVVRYDYAAGKAYIEGAGAVVLSDIPKALLPRLALREAVGVVLASRKGFDHAYGRLLAGDLGERHAVEAKPMDNRRKAIMLAIIDEVVEQRVTAHHTSEQVHALREAASADALERVKKLKIDQIRNMMALPRVVEHFAKLEGKSTSVLAALTPTPSP